MSLRADEFESDESDDDESDDDESDENESDAEYVDTVSQQPELACEQEIIYVKTIVNPNLPVKVKIEAHSNNDDNPETAGCRVCGEETTKRNHGVIACDSCALFFSRSCVPEVHGKWKCKEGLCNINVESRRRCRLCRFNKCVAVGMVKGK